MNVAIVTVALIAAALCGIAMRSHPQIAAIVIGDTHYD